MEKSGRKEKSLLCRGPEIERKRFDGSGRMGCKGVKTLRFIAPDIWRSRTLSIRNSRVFLSDPADWHTIRREG